MSGKAIEVLIQEIVEKAEVCNVSCRINFKLVDDTIIPINMIIDGFSAHDIFYCLIDFTRLSIWTKTVPTMTMMADV